MGIHKMMNVHSPMAEVNILGWNPNGGSGGGTSISESVMMMLSVSSYSPSEEPPFEVGICSYSPSDANSGSDGSAAYFLYRT